VAMRALGFEPKKEEIKKMIADIDKVREGVQRQQPALNQTNCSALQLLSATSRLSMRGGAAGFQHWLGNCCAQHVLDWFHKCRTAAEPSTSRSSCR
jgi:hypothetical protein